jgi:hypothetical protein
MAVALPLAMAGEAVALAFYGKPLGNGAGTAADVFGWVFAAAFLAVFVLMIADQERKMRAGHRPKGSSQPGH